MADGRTIEIYLPTGKANVARFESTSGDLRAWWFTREWISQLRDVAASELTRAGLYVLVGEDERPQKFYVGQSPKLGRRLRRHNRKKTFWRRGLLFCAQSNRLNRGHVEWIEGQLIELVTRAEHYEMDNAVQPAPVDLYDTDLAYAGSLLSQILEVLLLTGFIVFDSADDLQSRTKPQAASSTLTSKQSLDDDCCALLIELQKHEGWVTVPEFATALGWRTRSNREGRIRARRAALTLDAGGLATMRRGNRSYELRFRG